MSDQFLGQISVVGFNFAPYGWATCSGQILPISQYTALFSLLGTQFGGNGTSNFQLPNMQGNVPVCMGQSPGLTQYTIGETGGSQSVTLLASETPNHTHAPLAGSTRTPATSPAGGSFANSEAGNVYSASTSPLNPFSTSVINTFGGSQPHNNMMPYLCLTWVIALTGIFPTRS
jgi:microcystin-dependent protein